MRNLYRTIYVLAALTLIVTSGGCDFIKGFFGKDETAVQEAYTDYRKAMLSGDIEALKNLVSKDKVRELEGPNAARMLQFAKSVMPSQANITEVKVEGDRATLSLQSAAEGGTVSGTARLVKEDGSWRISQENWKMNMGQVMTEGTAPEIPQSQTMTAAQTTSAGVPSLTARQTEVQPGGQITVEFSGIQSPASQDWISLYKRGVPNENYGEWYYLKSQGQGSLTFKAPNEDGDYEFRLFLNWPQGGYNDVARSGPIRISRGGAMPQSTGSSNRLDNTVFRVGDEIRVHFTAPSHFVDNAWVGIIPSSVPHGNEALNDQYDLTYQYLNRRTSGTLVFHAPQQPGQYDMRMHDTDNNGSEVVSVSFSVAVK
ncbi:MAG: nuclear transport factor 2 family protein [Nitrospirae bacterium]|nr:nuclear transport factor 2 family protein [Nitrospirota bacterium]